jgi:hypothetical protein
MTGGWGVNIGAFMRHYDGWLIRACRPASATRVTLAQSAAVGAVRKPDRAGLHPHLLRRHGRSPCRT